MKINKQFSKALAVLMAASMLQLPVSAQELSSAADVFSAEEDTLAQQSVVMQRQAELQKEQSEAEARHLRQQQEDEAACNDIPQHNSYDTVYGADAFVDITIDEATFPDDAIRALISGYDSDLDGVLEQSEASYIYSITLPVEAENTKGLELLPNLRTIIFSDDYYDEVTIENLPYVNNINFYSNPTITKLTISDCPAVTSIYATSTTITDFTIKDCEKFNYISAYGSTIAFMTLSNLPSLTTASLWNGTLYTLTLDKLYALKSLDVDNNYLTKLDLNGCPMLESLNAGGNALTELNISGCKYLDYIYVSNNDGLLLPDCSNNPYLSGTKIYNYEDIVIGSTTTTVTAADFKKLGFDPTKIIGTSGTYKWVTFNDSTDTLTISSGYSNRSFAMQYDLGGGCKYIFYLYTGDIVSPSLSFSTSSNVYYLSWNHVDKATSYRIYVYTTEGLTLVDEIKTNYYTLDLNEYEIAEDYKKHPFCVTSYSSELDIESAKIFYSIDSISYWNTGGDVVREGTDVTISGYICDWSYTWSGGVYNFTNPPAYYEIYRYKGTATINKDNSVDYWYESFYTDSLYEKIATVEPVLDSEGYPTYTYTDKNRVANKHYAYGIIAYNSEGLVLGYDNINTLEALPVWYIDANDITKTSVQLEWYTNDEDWAATSFRIYRADLKNGEKTLIKTLSPDFAYNEEESTSSTNHYTCTDTTLTFGNKYYYYVTSYDSATGMESKYSSAEKVIAGRDEIIASYVNTPEISSVTQVDTSALVKWNAIEGATSYRVSRADSLTGTKTLLKTVGGTSCTDTTAVAGKTYYYFVQSNNSSTGVLSQYSDGVSITMKADVSIAAPTLPEKPFFCLNDIITVKWNAVEGATSYRVYRATSETGTKTLLKTTGILQFTDQPKSGTYYYYIAAYNSKTGQLSDYSPAIKVSLITKPVIYTCTYEDGGVYMTWNTVNTATSYRVFRTDADTGVKTQIKTVGFNHCNDTNIAAGKTYTYTVQAFNNNLKILSASATAKTITIPSGTKPVITSAEKITEGVALSWEGVKDATSYKIYRADSATGAKTLLKTTGILRFTDGTAKAGNTYYYFVVAYNSKTGVSSEYSEAKSITV